MTKFFKSKQKNIIIHKDRFCKKFKRSKNKIKYIDSILEEALKYAPYHIAFTYELWKIIINDLYSFLDFDFLIYFDKKLSAERFIGIGTIFPIIYHLEHYHIITNKKKNLDVEKYLNYKKLVE
jgi:hypothetical protein